MDPTVTKLILQSIANSQGAQKTFTDMLKERRAFVQGNENDVSDFNTNLAKNGSNGVPVDPTTLNGNTIALHTDNANKTAALTQQMFGYGQQANDAIKTLGDLLDSASGRSIQQGQLKNDQANTNLNYLENGFNPPNNSSGGTGGTPGTDNNSSDGTNNSLVESLAQNVASGKQKPEQLNVPQALKQKVISRAYQLGYDPAKDVNGVINQLEQGYFNPNGKGSIAQGNSVTNTAGNDIADLLSYITGGAVKTPGEQKLNGYEDLSKSVSPFLLNTLGVTPNQLPSRNDSEAQAKSKIASLRKIVADKFYQGGPGPTQNNSSSGIGSGGYTIEEVK